MANKWISLKNEPYERYYRYVLKSDVREVLARCGRIPASATSAYIGEILANEKVKGEVEDVTKAREEARTKHEK